MIDFHTSEYVPAVPGFRIVPEASVIHVGISAYLEPWHREMIMAHVMRVAIGEIRSDEEPVAVPHLRVVND